MTKIATAIRMRTIAPPPPLPLERLRERAAAPAPAAALPPLLPPPEKQNPRAAHDQVADERDDADEDGGDDEKLDVAVADVGQLVGEHRLELGVVERVDEAAGHRDRIAALADAAGEGVARVGLDDAERRRGDAAADAEVLEEVPDARLGACGRRGGRR